MRVDKIMMMGFALAVTSAAHAATITWSSFPATVSGGSGEILNTGLFDTNNVVYAENTGGSAQTFDNINFGDGKISFGYNYSDFHVGNKPSQTGTFVWPAAECTVTLGTGGLPELTIGQHYKVQVLVYDGRPSALYNGSSVLFDGVNQGIYANGIANVTWGNGLLVVGTFKADAVTQAFTIQAVTVNGVSQMNALVLSTISPPPTFSPPGAGYNSEQSVTLTAETGWTIHYTTDGSDPVTSGTRISGASPISDIVVPLPTNETINAYATLSGETDSAVVSATYRTYATAPTVAWMNLSGGNWATAANWTDGFVANGIGITADFSTLTLTANTAVTLDKPATVGNLLLADQGNAYDWSITSGTLTLNTLSDAPEINVSNRAASISSVLDGTQGLTKTGAGTLTLSRVNTYSGGTTINAGTLATSEYATFGTGAITIGTKGTYALNTLVYGNQPTFANAVSGAGAFSVTGNPSGGTQSFWSGDWSDFSGTLIINTAAGLWFRSSANTGSTAMKLSLSGNFGLYDNESGITRTCHLGELSGATGSLIYGNPNTGNAITLSVGALNTSSTFAGIMQNNWANNGSSTLSLTKVGAGTLTLSGANTFGGTIRIENGTIIPKHATALGSNPAITLAGGTLDVQADGAVVPAKALDVSSASTLKTKFDNPATLSVGAMTDVLSLDVDITDASVNVEYKLLDAASKPSAGDFAVTGSYGSKAPKLIFKDDGVYFVIRFTGTIVILF